MAQKRLDKHVHATYFTSRIGIAIIAVAFPLILYFGGRLYAGLPLQDSMSAYCHASQAGKFIRGLFVGNLLAVGVFLYLRMERGTLFHR